MQFLIHLYKLLTVVCTGHWALGTVCVREDSNVSVCMHLLIAEDWTSVHSLDNFRNISFHAIFLVRSLYLSLCLLNKNLISTRIDWALAPLEISTRCSIRIDQHSFNSNYTISRLHLINKYRIEIEDLRR